MSREDPQMKIRLPADLKDQIEAIAKQSGRSMNAEIVARLQESLNPPPNIFINDFSGVTTLASPRTKLSQLAGKLNRCQDQRNTLSVLLHAVKSNGGSADEVNRITEEIQAIDADITSILSAMQHFTNPRLSDH